MVEKINIQRKLEIWIKKIICQLAHEGYSEVIFYSPQNLCYTTECLICGKLSYIGAGGRLPTGFHEKAPEDAKTILDKLYEDKNDKQYKVTNDNGKR